MVGATHENAEILYQTKTVYGMRSEYYQGLPWLRICCSQHFSQMEIVGAKWNSL